jgi:hypothetical protein
MKPNLKIEEEDLKILFIHTKAAYGGMSFNDWKKDCKKSYLSYFENKPLFSKKKYTYSQFVNTQIISLT